jgi:hypothetical protein
MIGGGAPYDRVGKVTTGEHEGMFVLVEADESGTGWHIWLLSEDPRVGPSSGWDIWADELEDVDEWLGPENLNVEWIE